MSETLLQVTDLGVAIRRNGALIPVVDGLSLTVTRGQTLCLVGESGCGKSLTALALMRLLPAGTAITSGTVMLDGTDLLRLPERDMRQKRGARIAMVFQEPMTSLNPVMTIGAQVAEVVRLHGPQITDPARRVVELLEQVGLPDPAERLHAYPFQLSGGQKQRVMIAMALAADPDLIIADEPTTALDVTLQAQVLDLLVDLKQQRGLGLLLITHDLGVVRRMADRVAVMYAGQIVEEADAGDFFRRPQHPYSRRLFAALPGLARSGQALAGIPGRVPAPGEWPAGCRFAGRCHFAADACQAPIALTVLSGAPDHQVRCVRVQQGELLEMPEVSPPAAADRPATAQPLLVVDRLSVHYSRRVGWFQRSTLRAADQVSFAIPAATTVALVGESGCGKTTVARALLQLIRPTSGSVQLAGEELTTLSADAMRRRRADMQMVFQDPFASLDPRMKVGRIIEEGMTALRPNLSAVERLDLVQQALAAVGLPMDAAGRYPHEFSGGQRQRIAIARALVVEPKLIICDEPTSALDVSVQAQILNLLGDLQRSRQIAYLLISHNIDVVAYMADQILVMYLGRIIEAGPAAVILQAPLHPYTQMLLAAAPRVEDCPEVAVSQSYGDLPSAARPPTGCHFHPRCPQATDQCRHQPPPERIDSDGRRVVCWLYALTS